MSSSTFVSDQTDPSIDHGAILADFASKASLGTLPHEVIVKLKHLLIDTLGVTLGALDQAHAEQARAVVAASECAPKASVFGTDLRTSAPEAAFANGVAAHGIDFDDTHKFVHPGCAVVPAVLALAEHRDASGADVLAALAAGYEVSIRVAFAAGVEHRLRGFHPTGTCNVFGAAAGAARILGLDATTTASAIGAASSMSGGLTQYRLDGAANKHLHGGLAARSGVLSALLAEQGFHGTAHALDGELGYLNLYSDGGDLAALTGGLGDRFDLLDTDFKPYPSCRQSHAPVDLAMQASTGHGIKADQVEKITVFIYTYADKPWYTTNAVPASPLKAFLSIPYCVASTILYGRLGLEEFTQNALADPRLPALIAKISVTADTALDTNWPAERGARLEFEKTDGEMLVLSTTDPIGGSVKPMSVAEIIRKFDGLTEGVLSPSGRAAFLKGVEHLEDLASVRDLVQELAPSA
jgi:2-methylcitrate dehydratase PrpD